MQSRMDKYNTSASTYKSRTERNKDLYSEVHNSDLKEFDIKSNSSVLEDNAKSINVNKVNKLLDSIYSDDVPKRKSIQIPDYMNTKEEIEEEIVNTKEYDINAILKKEKEGRNVDYNNERLKSVRSTQYNILKDLDLKIDSDNSYKKRRKQEAENLVDLINTITHIEQINKEKYNKESSEALDLLSDLSETQHVNLDEDVTEANKKELLDEETIKEKIIEELEEKENKTADEIKDKLETADEKIEKTLQKLNIDLSSYEDFSDISKKDTASIILKIIIFLIIIALIIGAVFILNNILGLELF